MDGINRAYLMGHVGQDPELRTTGSGMAVLKLSIATPSPKKVDDQWIDTPDWHRVTAFGKTAEYIARVARKGTVLGVECQVKPKKWTNKEGVSQYSVELYVDRVMCCIPKQRTAPVEVDAPPAAREQVVTVDGEEIPF